MTVSALIPFSITALYLLGLGIVARWVDASPSMDKIARHPLILGMALGVYCTSWTLFGSVGYAHTYGYEFLAISLGVVLSCLSIPALWSPIGDIVRRHRLTSVADLLALRFGSQVVATWVTLLLVAGLLPYLSLQMRAISDAGSWLSPGAEDASFGGSYALLLVGFTVFLGARYTDPRRRRPGLMITLALESLIKGLLFLGVGGAALYGVFGGVEGLEVFLSAHPEATEALLEPLRGGGAWGALLVTTFAAAFLLPRQFHVAFVEEAPPGALRRGAWVLSAYLLLVNLPIPILLWAGGQVAPEGTAPDDYVMAVSGHIGTSLLAFLAGVSASSAMILVCTIALTGMVVNHLILPLSRGRTWSVEALLSLRRAVMTALVIAGFVAQHFLPDGGSIVNLGLVSFVAVLQLLPGVLATLFWRGASRRGLLLGLGAGALAWIGITAFPLLGGGAPGLEELGASFEPRSLALLGSVGLNATVFALGSILWPPGESELMAAESCAPYGAMEPAQREGTSVAVLRARMAEALGEETANSLLEGVRASEGLSPGEALGPRGLRQLTRGLEGELAQLIGPLGAKALLGRRGGDGASSSLAVQLEQLRSPGANASTYGRERVLMGVQRYLLSVLEELPLGILGVDDAEEITLWNGELAQLSGIREADALGLDLGSLPSPWGGVFREGLGMDPGVEERPLSLEGRRLTLRLRTVTLPPGAGRALILEDLTERRALRAEAAHQDRLASIGRLAAGVAHEILNPLTGVLMVARNLQLEPEAEDGPERLGLIVSESRRIETIVRELLGFSRRGGGGTAQPIDLQDLCAEALRLSQLSRGEGGLVFKVEVPPGLEVMSQRQGLLQVLTNLLGNAWDASPPGGRVWLCARRDGHWAEVEVRDEGPGVALDLREHIFEPFVTTKPPGEGTGLGLTVSHRIIQDLGGTLSLGESVAGGARFVIRLPIGHPPGSNSPLVDNNLPQAPGREPTT